MACFRGPLIVAHLLPDNGIKLQCLYGVSPEANPNAERISPSAARLGEQISKPHML